jgi:predicted enzyme related to lactoylglutathione lyase
VAKLADAAPLKGASPSGERGFESRPGHFPTESGKPRLEPRQGHYSWQDGGVERVLGIGGYFLRAADPEALGAWYRECLGLAADENGLWRQAEGPTVFATFESDSDHLGSHEQRSMLNFRVGDLDAMLAQLRAAGAAVEGEPQEIDGVGRFGWVTDPEGNRIELWQPA